MKSFLGVAVVSAVFGVAICALAGMMCLVGFGTPNCEPTTYGYAEFWGTLFASSFLACFGAWCVVAVLCVAEKFITKGK